MSHASSLSSFLFSDTNDKIGRDDTMRILLHVSQEAAPSADTQRYHSNPRF